MTTLMQELADRHASVGAVRSLGLFGVIELVRDHDTRVPLAPFNGSSPEMAALGRELRSRGLYTFVRWHSVFTNPPLSISDTELREGFAIIDRALTVVDDMRS
jgi:taurine--2-oxoglutarate transaminase